MQTNPIIELEKYRFKAQLFDEYNLFIGIFTVGFLLHYGSSSELKNVPIVSEEDQLFYQEMQKINVQQLSRFGVDPNQFKDPEQCVLSQWYLFWFDWHDSLNSEQHQEIDKRLKLNLSIDQFLPKKDWNEL